MELHQIISELLLHNNCVIIPGLGGFIANDSPAKFDSVSGVFLPPRKLVTFNKSLLNNDGLLVNTFATKNALNYDDAKQIIDEKVAFIKKTLNNGQRVYFENVGSLVKNTDGFINFEQDRFFNLLLASFGLEQLKFMEQTEKIEETNVIHASNDAAIEIAEPTQNESNAKDDLKVIDLNVDKNTSNNESTQNIEEVSKTRWSTRLVKYAAAAAFLPVLFYSFWIPMKTDVLKSKVLYVSDFNPFSVERQNEYKYTEHLLNLQIEEVQFDNELDKLNNSLPLNVSAFPYQLNDNRYLIVKRDIQNKEELTDLSNENSNELNSASTKSNISNHNYHLIGGCFSEISNANQFVQSMKNEGFNAFIVDKNKGLHRVSIAAGNSANDLSAFKSKANALGVNFWLLKM